MTEESPLPRMLDEHVTAMQVILTENDGELYDALREVAHNIEAQASGRLQTYSPESEVRVPKEALQELLEDLEAMAFNLPHTTSRPIQTVRGWLVSTKQEVSE